MFQERRAHGLRNTIRKGPTTAREQPALVSGIGMAPGTSGRVVSRK